MKKQKHKQILFMCQLKIKKHSVFGINMFQSMKQAFKHITKHAIKIYFIS